MSIDPYHEVQSEIQSSLQAAEQLRASFLRIRSTAREGNEELELVRNEVRLALLWVVRRNCAHRLFPFPPGISSEGHSRLWKRI
jgi:hypothetical protein